MELTEPRSLVLTGLLLHVDLLLTPHEGLPNTLFLVQHIMFILIQVLFLQASTDAFGY